MKVFIIAGEASGDKLGTEMMKGLQHLAGDKVQFAGVGGAGMIGQGLKCHSITPFHNHHF